ncbi:MULTISPECIES: heme lyase NrfEFG subunit NrfF [Yersinia]|uniref:Formate-dependent nitrite reductase complex subunit n=1 Tax=Yersinia rochesterensis TaxID=1604335 RepID=A0A386HFR8_9GAMM|nr:MULTISPECIES: heme lyase NrfEFG subunit NrfF [Yersinia]AJI87515.1 cytochrome C biogenesis family protein [Yersinia frederiksenii Y225]CNG78388.1 cytochrome c-type heme lyase subunit nrfF%2Cnitrite reductase complex assembly [Yersinia kristensenii]AIN19088.1 cytochrome C biogenesis family protein [Yersinia rochesterensis]AJJ36553.1 cytochrome C biogenesis family protein [Yersinia rochesterensis]AYD44420.1 heme lyase NrfEFG subunit NrfF [Yersinia rochesterensis]
MKTLLLLLSLVFSPWVLADLVDTYHFSSQQNQQQALALAKELRCPQCQNQNLLESTSPIAQDLRLEVYRLVEAGHSSPEIMALMTQRYGDFVLYRPPVRSATLILWFGPGVLLAGVLGGLVLRIRNRAASSSREGR